MHARQISAMDWGNWGGRFNAEFVRTFSIHCRRHSPIFIPFMECTNSLPLLPTVPYRSPPYCYSPRTLSVYRRQPGLASGPPVIYCCCYMFYAILRRPADFLVHWSVICSRWRVSVGREYRLLSHGPSPCRFLVPVIVDPYVSLFVRLVSNERVYWP
jgi:hypothetical protein